MGLAVLLGVSVPVVLGYLSPAGPDLGFGLLPWAYNSAFIVLLTCSTLYVSSLSTSGVRALVLSIPFALGGLLFVQGLALLPFSALGVRLGRFPHVHLEENLVAFALLASVAALLLIFAMQNHRSAECRIRRVGTQLFWIAGVLTLDVVTAVLLGL